MADPGFSRPLRQPKRRVCNLISWLFFPKNYINSKRLDRERDTHPYQLSPGPLMLKEGANISYRMISGQNISILLVLFVLNDKSHLEGNSDPVLRLYWCQERTVGIRTKSFVSQYRIYIGAFFCAPSPTNQNFMNSEADPARPKLKCRRIVWQAKRAVLKYA